MSKRLYQKRGKDHQHSIDDIVLASLDYYAVGWGDLFTKSRNPRIVDTKRAICWIARKSGYSLLEIGHILNRHHTTVIRHIETAEGYISVDRIYRENFRNLIKKFDLNFD